MNDKKKSDTFYLDLFKGGVVLFLLFVLMLSAERSRETAPPIASAGTPSVTPTIAGMTLPTPEVEVSEDGTVAFNGTGTAGNEVELWVNGLLFGQTTINSDGTWSYSGSLEDGDYQVVIVMRDSSGDLLSESAFLELTVSFGSTSPGATSVPNPTSAPAPTGTSPPPVPTIGQVSVNTSGEVTITGTGQPGQRVIIYRDGLRVAAADVGPDGTYEVVFESTSDQYDYEVQNKGVPPTGNPSAGVQVTAPAPQPTLVPIPPGGLTYVVQPGDGLMELARRYYGDPARWVDIFVATNAKAYEDPSYAILVNPNYIVAGWQIFIPED
jgi:Bacterial Ig-like domain